MLEVTRELEATERVEAIWVTLKNLSELEEADTGTALDAIVLDATVLEVAAALPAPADIRLAPQTPFLFTVEPTALFM